MTHGDPLSTRQNGVEGCAEVGVAVSLQPGMCASTEVCVCVCVWGDSGWNQKVNCGAYAVAGYWPRAQSLSRSGSLSGYNQNK